MAWVNVKIGDCIVVKPEKWVSQYDPRETWQIVTILPFANSKQQHMSVMVMSDGSLRVGESDALYFALNTDGYDVDPWIILSGDEDSERTRSSVVDLNHELRKELASVRTQSHES